MKPPLTTELSPSLDDSNGRVLARFPVTKQRLRDFRKLAGRRIKTALTTLPDKEGWRWAGSAIGIFFLVTLIFGFSSGLLIWNWAGHPDGLTILRFSLTSIMFPGIFEEVLFRVLPLPSRGEQPRRLGYWFNLSIVIFVAWHVITALTWFPQSQFLFLDWRFLFIVVMLGVTNNLVYLHTNSIWPCTAMHWLTVVIWKVCLGGPNFPL